MNRILAFLAAVACLVPAALAAAAPRDAAALLEDLVRALNSADPADRRAFAETRCAKDVPAAERAAKLDALAERGAPFRIEMLKADSERTAAALVVDKGGERLSFRLEAGDGAEPLMAGLLVGDPAALEGKPPGDYSKWTTLQGLADAIAKDTESPAMGIACLRDGKLEAAVTGVREIGKGEAVSIDEPWSLGSIGKPICSTVVALLIEKGKLRFETTLKEALPDVPMKPVHESITLEDLMKHRSGLPQDENFRGPDIQRIVGDAKAPRDIRARYVADILSREPIAKRDTRFAYSNAGYAILSHVAERAAGMPYEELVRKTVFEPLGMANSYAGSDTLPAARPSGHMPGPNGLRPMNLRGALESMVAGAGGGMHASVGDLARFGAAHLAGLRGDDGLLKAETVDRLHSGMPEGGPGGMLYACGWGIHRHPAVETWHGHNGSNGTFRAEMAVFPKANLVIVGIVNRGGENDPAPGLEAVLAVAGRYAAKKKGGG